MSPEPNDKLVRLAKAKKAAGGQVVVTTDVEYAKQMEAKGGIVLYDNGGEDTAAEEEARGIPERWAKHAKAFGWHPHADENGALPHPLTVTGPDGETLYDETPLADGWRPRPADLPDWRQELVDAWRPDGSLTRISPMVAAASGGSQQFHPYWEHAVAADARLWLVGDDMCDLLVEAAPTMRPFVLTPDHLPDEAGLVVFETPLLGIDAEGTGFPTHTGAMLWGPAVHGPSREAMLSITVYAPFPRPPHLMPLGSVSWPFGRSVDDGLYDLAADGVVSTDSRVASWIEDRRRLAALWLLSAQPRLVEPAPARVPNRAVARRAARAGLDPRVRVIHLRSAVPRDPEAPARGTRTYRHRWTVDGFWRKWPNDPPESDRQVYVNPHIKGPAGAPFLHPADVVKVWDK